MYPQKKFEKTHFPQIVATVETATCVRIIGALILSAGHILVRFRYILGG